MFSMLHARLGNGVPPPAPRMPHSKATHEANIQIPTLRFLHPEPEPPASREPKIAPMASELKWLARLPGSPQVARLFLPKPQTLLRLFSCFSEPPLLLLLPRDEPGRQHGIRPP
jgi:hypothetical protein